MFRSLADSTSGAGRDQIVDLTVSGGETDRIDLSAIDANLVLSGNQAFGFIGANVFSNAAGELQAVRLGSYTLIQGDVNGDGARDAAILLQGALTLANGNSIL